MQRLTEKEYYSLEATTLFSEKDNRCNNCFGFITIGEHNYKFSWNSNLIEPTIELLDSNIYGIGIDQHFCLLNSNNGVFNCWDLDTPFLYMIVYERYVIVICETNILLINLDISKIEKEYMFIEIISDVRLENRFMRITFINDSELDISIDDNNNPFVKLLN
jgi:hypothetical protein